MLIDKGVAFLELEHGELLVYLAKYEPEEKDEKKRAGRNEAADGLVHQDRHLRVRD